MTSRIRRTALALVAALGLITAPLLVSASASAADLTGVSAVFFSNDLFTDTDEEDVQLAAGLAGATLTYFDGGDGSDTAWNAALAGQTLLVFPEMDNDDLYEAGGTSAMSDAAAAAVAAWVNAGGRILAADPYGILDLLDVISGTTVFTAGGIFDTSGSPWPLLVPTDGLPATLTSVNATDGFSLTAIAGLTNVPLYGTGNASVVNQFSFGSGFVTTLGYDWYPDSDDIADGLTAEWNTVLQYVAAKLYGAPAPEPVPAVVPTLPDTGSQAPAPALWIGGALLVAFGGVLLVARSRAAASRR